MAKSDKETPAKEKVEKDIQNGIQRPKVGTITRRVWDHADQLSAAAGSPVVRSVLLEACAADKEPINPATVATQYGRWRKYYGLVGVGKTPEEEKAAEEKKKAAAEKRKATMAAKKAKKEAEKAAAAEKAEEK